MNKSQHENLRSGFNYLVTTVLGVKYYNLGADVYQADNECISDMISKFNKLEDKVTKYKILSTILGVLLTLSLIGHLL